MDRFYYFCDGEYEYRIERGLEDSAAMRLAPGGKHGRVQGFANIPDHRVWRLVNRPIAQVKIAIVDGCSPPCVDDGTQFVRGGPDRTLGGPWTHAADCYLPNAQGIETAARRLLGAGLLAACEAADTDAAAGRRAQANAAPATVRVDLA